MIRKILKRKLVRLQRAVNGAADTAALLVVGLAWEAMDALEAKRRMVPQHGRDCERCDAMRRFVMKLQVDEARATNALREIDLLVQQARSREGHAIAIGQLLRHIREGLSTTPTTFAVDDSLLGGSGIPNMGRRD